MDTGLSGLNNRVGIVIPVYGGWPHLSELLSDLDRCSFELEIVVVDDCSPIPKPEWLKLADPRIRLVRRSENGGYAAAINTGVAALRSAPSVICISNSDIRVPEPEGLHRLFRSARVNRRCVVAPRLTDVTGKTVLSTRTFPTATMWFANLSPVVSWVQNRIARPPVQDGNNNAGYLKNGYVSGAFLCFSAFVWQAVGPWDERFRFYSEEVDWQLRCSLEKVGRAVTADVEVVHDSHHGESSARDVERRFALLWTARTEYAMKWWSVVYCRKAACLLLVGSAVAFPQWVLQLSRRVGLFDGLKLSVIRYRHIVACARRMWQRSPQQGNCVELGCLRTQPRVPKKSLSTDFGRVRQLR